MNIINSEMVYIWNEVIISNIFIYNSKQYIIINWIFMCSKQKNGRGHLKWGVFFGILYIAQRIPYSVYSKINQLFLSLLWVILANHLKFSHVYFHLSPGSVTLVLLIYEDNCETT